MTTRRAFIASGLAAGLAGCTDVIERAASEATIRLELHGWHVPDAGVTASNQDAVTASVADAVGVEPTAVRTFTGEVSTVEDTEIPAGTVELRSKGDPEQFVAGLSTAGLDVSPGDERRGVTEFTGAETVRGLEARLDDTDQVQITYRRRNGRSEILIGGSEEAVASIDVDGLTTTSDVAVVAHVPADNEQGYEEQVLLRQQDMEPGTVQTDSSTGQPYVPISLTSDAAERMSEYMVQSGFANNPGQCAFDNDNLGENEPPYGWCLLTTVDGEIVYGAGIRPGFAQNFRSGQFEDEQRYRTTTTTMEDAVRVRSGLLGRLPTPVEVVERDV